VTMLELEALDRDAFLGTVGWVFEHSSWVAERAWEKRPFLTPQGLYAAMVGAIQGASDEEQLALLRAHPDLGSRAGMSTASEGEQAGAGLDRLTPSEFERLGRLNTAYRVKFGFPFIYAVKGASKHAILEALESRLAGDPASERAIALEQTCRIAQFRLESIFSCTCS
jgi:2-oxo-4-hydroxy-4-carboxy-5-ureidoimidazoline decarboxylase